MEAQKSQKGADGIIMKRKIYQQLLDWKEKRNGEVALLVEGARRIGKPIFRFTWHLYCKYKERKSRIGAISLMIVCPRNGIRNSYQNVHDCLNA